MKLELKDYNHPYYCEVSNFYSNKANKHYGTVSQFLAEFRDADVDMNLCFRWDIREKYEDEEEKIVIGFRLDLFLILQRKGIFMPVCIDQITESDLRALEEYLQNHLETMRKNWSPLLPPPQPNDQ